MLSINLDSILEKKIRKFSEENNIKAEELIETVMFDFIDSIEEKSGTIKLDEEEADNYNEADYEYLEKIMGFKRMND